MVVREVRRASASGDGGPSPWYASMVHPDWPCRTGAHLAAHGASAQRSTAGG